ncbi:uncharacterized protein LY79DRAFT_409861 [Colletotrichum navitas]|uniref:Uncharacterized protein n=1 Tax=Colletotrichum navitas TaxID=681940 RepID=A0AAD8PNM7_9PEZI|nr:uncharacterized protein LY79DRAFT_409861 [Colletotrichum navitas]KAK1573534.1 hypothetical protein LY79DRAFT_409861 [Colletotrichum navitas]
MYREFQRPCSSGRRLRHFGTLTKECILVGDRSRWGSAGKSRTKIKGTPTTLDETRPRNRHRASASRRPPYREWPGEYFHGRRNTVGICNYSKSDKLSTMAFPRSTGSPNPKSPFQLQIFQPPSARKSHKQGAALGRKLSSATQKTTPAPARIRK